MAIVPPNKNKTNNSLCIKGGAQHKGADNQAKCVALQLKSAECVTNNSYFYEIFIDFRF